jgi:hypothetical protein
MQTNPHAAHRYALKRYKKTIKLKAQVHHNSRSVYCRHGETNFALPKQAPHIKSSLSRSQAKASSDF